MKMIKNSLLILLCGFSVYSASCSNAAGSSDFEKEVFDAEKAAWEAINIGDYYLALTHILGSQSFSSYAQVTENILSYLETGNVSLALTAESFPFLPLAETIDDIYNTVENVWQKGLPVTISFDPQTHTPKRIKIEGYDKNGNDYVLLIDFGVEPFDDVRVEKRTNDIVNFDMEYFKNEKAAWEAQGISAYRFTARMLLDMPAAPVQITVKGTEEPEIAFIDTDFMSPDIEISALYGKTIQEIYDSIEKDIEKHRQAPPEDDHTWVEILIEYDTEYHYPRSYSLCYYYDDLPEPGGFVGIEIADFEILPVDLESTETGEDPFGREEGFDWERLQQEKAAWEAQDIETYRFTAKALLDIATRPFTVTVTEGLTALEDEMPDVLFGTTISDIYSRIEDVFRETTGSYTSYTKDGYTLKSRARYNGEYHYPEFIWWGLYYNGEVLDGGGAGLEISAFEIL
jgi:hypothetical protein